MLLSSIKPLRLGWKHGALLASIAMGLLTGFTPFNGDGFAQFQILEGSGELLQTDPDEARWTTVEADVIFHSLSSRYGGGGVFAYMEYPATNGESGLLLIDLRHGGLSDQQRVALVMPDPQRADLYFQQWDSRKDTFRAASTEGTITVDELFRGNEESGIAFEFDLVFFDWGPDGKRRTDDDRWRRVRGATTTYPTVQQLLRRGGTTVYRDSNTNHGTDGDIVVGCFGATEVEETAYEDESYVVEDDDDGCEGDTWEDDAEEPDETAGCAGKRTVDEGDPDPDGGCDTSGDELSSDPDDSYYDEDDTGDSGGCEEDSDDSSTACDTDSEAEAAGLDPRKTAYLRRYLDDILMGNAHRPLARRLKGRWTRSQWRTVDRLLGYLPFFLLAIGIHIVRRRLRRA